VGVTVTGEDAFIRVILLHAGDDGPWLVYADWLEERGDPRGAVIRARPELRRFVARLTQVADVYGPFNALETWAAAGRSDLLLDLVRLLSGPWRQAPVNVELPGVIDALVRHVEELLSLTPVEGNAAAALSLLDRDGMEPRHVRAAASRLASAQPPDALLALLAGDAGCRHRAELFACLVQEMVVRGADLRNHPAAARWATAGHPLAGLPLYRTDAEAGLDEWLPRYGNRGSSSFTPAGLPSQYSAVLPATGSGDPAALRLRGARADPRIRAAVRDWPGEPNDSCEVRSFRAHSPVTRANLSLDLLAALNLECLAGDAAVRAALVPPGRALGVLFAAAANGGAYGPGLQGAYGRRAAWESLAGLAGAPPGAGVEAVAEVARRCLWVEFDADSGWFDHIAWDLGLLAVRPDGRSLAVLAATDAD
jgi:uncharacterized protein (TIGR02996 family)